MPEDESTKTAVSFWRRNWKLIITLITLFALLGLVYAIRDQLVETIANLRHVNLWILLLIIPVEALNYHAQTKLYQQLFTVVGNKLSYRFLFRASLELNFVNHVFPSGGVSGISYFGLRLKDGTTITASKATLVQLMKLVLTIVSFEAILFIGLLILASTGRVSNLMIMVAASLMTILIIATLLFIYIIGNKSRINTFFVTLTRLINWLLQLVRGAKHPETINIERARDSFDDMHVNYQLFWKHRHELRMPLLYAVLMNVTELMALYVVYAAFGEYVNVGAVILAYGVANFAGLVSVLPGGVGIYEFLMTSVLAAGGVPARISLPVTVMYRVINTAIQVPPGYYLYHRAVLNGAEDKRGD
jgi:uncharacterized protein (TIRG00374 family)